MWSVWKTVQRRESTLVNLVLQQNCRCDLWAGESLNIDVRFFINLDFECNLIEYYYTEIKSIRHLFRIIIVFFLSVICFFFPSENYLELVLLYHQKYIVKSKHKNGDCEQRKTHEANHCLNGETVKISCKILPSNFALDGHQKKTSAHFDWSTEINYKTTGFFTDLQSFAQFYFFLVGCETVYLVAYLIQLYLYHAWIRQQLTLAWHLYFKCVFKNTTVMRYYNRHIWLSFSKTNM